MAFEEAFRDLILQPMRAEPNTQRLMQTNPYRYDDDILDAVERGQVLCDQEHLALWYSYAYMYAYMMCHFDAFTRIAIPNSADLQNYIDEPVADLLMIDFGCGPMTSAVALADAFVERHQTALRLKYLGFDHAEPMRQIAMRFGRRPDLFHRDSTIFLRPTWSREEVTTATELVTENTSVILNFSYLFGQESFLDSDIDSLVDFVHELIAQNGHADNILMVYLNAPHYQKNRKYLTFKERLLPHLSSVLPDVISYTYRFPKRFVERYQRSGEIRSEVFQLDRRAI